jgi:hypothetical protein
MCVPPKKEKTIRNIQYKRNKQIPKDACNKKLKKQEIQQITTILKVVM